MIKYGKIDFAKAIKSWIQIATIPKEKKMFYTANIQETFLRDFFRILNEMFSLSCMHIDLV